MRGQGVFAEKRGWKNWRILAPGGEIDLRVEANRRARCDLLKWETWLPVVGCNRENDGSMGESLARFVDHLCGGCRHSQRIWRDTRSMIRLIDPASFSRSGRAR